MSIAEIEARLAKARKVNGDECGGRNKHFIAILEELRETKESLAWCHKVIDLNLGEAVSGAANREKWNKVLECLNLV